MHWYPQLLDRNFELEHRFPFTCPRWGTGFGVGRPMAKISPHDRLGSLYKWLGSKPRCVSH